MYVETNKKKRCAIGMYSTKQSSVVDISTNMSNSRKSQINIRGVVYS